MRHQLEAAWVPEDVPGIDHVRVDAAGDGIRADGLAVTVAPDGPVRLRYAIDCDGRWRTRRVRLEVEAAGGWHSLALHADGEGGWEDGSGLPLDELEGCLDVDVAGVPFANTLPIRRLRLDIGEEADLAVAWVDVPELSAVRSEQRYARIAARTYAFAAGDFGTELPVDAHGLVLDYPGLARRAWPR